MVSISSSLMPSSSCRVIRPFMNPWIMNSRYCAAVFSISTYWLIGRGPLSHFTTLMANVVWLGVLLGGCRPAIGEDWRAHVDDDALSAPLVGDSFVAVGTARALVVLNAGGTPRCRLDLGARVFTPRALEGDQLVIGSG